MKPYQDICLSCGGLKYKYAQKCPDCTFRKITVRILEASTTPLEHMDAIIAGCKGTIS